MAKDKKDLGKLIAVDMPNGYTYIGRGTVGNRPLMLKESFIIETSYLTQSNNKLYVQFAKDEYVRLKENLEKEIRIDNPGPIHFLED